MKIKVLLLLLVFVASCSNDEKKSSDNLDIPKKVNENLVSVPKTDSFLLRYKFKKNQKLKYKITTVSESNQQIETDSVISTVTKQNVEYLLSLIVRDNDSKNNWIIDFTMNSIKSEGTINGENISYESKYIYSTQERMIFAQYEALKNKTFSLKVSERGEVLEIFNMKEITNELIDIQQQSDKITIEQKKLLVQNFKDAAIRPLSEQLFRKFPTEAIGVNSNWDDRYYTKFAMFDIENIASFQIKNMEQIDEDSLVTVSAGLSINWTGSHEATDQGVKYYFYDPIVSGNGLITFNKTNGVIARSETSTSMQIVIDMEGFDATQKLVKGKRTDHTVNKNLVELIENIL